MVLPLEVGGAEDFGLWSDIGRSPATDRAIRLHSRSKRVLGTPGKREALAELFRRARSLRHGLKGRRGQIKVTCDRIDVLRAQARLVRMSGTGSRATG